MVSDDSSTSAQKLRRTRCSSNDIFLRNAERLLSSASGSGGDNVRMTEGLWGPLPDEVMSKILAFLPLVSLLRFRIVCKKWNSLLQDQEFQQNRARIRKRELYLEYIQLMGKSPSFARSQIVSSMEGLLLLTANDRDDIHIIDPSKASLKKIPPLPNLTSTQYIGCGMVKNQNVANKSCSGSRYYTVGMVMDPHSREYNILAVMKGHRGPVAMHLYDSSQDTWRSAGSIRPEPGQMVFHIVHIVMHDDSLHCLSVGFTDDDNPRFRVLRYEKQTRRWHELVGAFPEVSYYNRSSPLLFEHRGRLLFGGASRTSEFHIWQYDSEKLAWRMTDFLPNWTFPKAKGGMRVFSHSRGDHFLLGWDLLNCCVTVTQSGEERKTVVESSERIYNIVESSRLLSEDEKRVVCWHNRRFLYESSPFIQ